MKPTQTPTVLAALACALLLLTGCEMLDGAAHWPDEHAALRASEDAWQAQVQQRGESYAWRSDLMSWTGWGLRIWTVVEDGRVVRREIREFDGSMGGSRLVGVIVEEGDTLGTASAPPPETLADVYAGCRADVLTRAADVWVPTIATDAEGVLTVCSARPRDCADDCGEGWTIGARLWPDADGDIALPPPLEIGR